MDFSGKTVMITGAAGNLGQATARAFYDAGAQLLLLDRDVTRLRAAWPESDPRCRCLAVDLLDSDAVAAAVAAWNGAIDVLCNIAGGFRMGQPVHATPDADWDFLFGLNMRSVLHTARAVVPHMQAAGHGRIVSVATNAGLRGAARMGAYCASKDAVVRMTEAMSAELRDDGINVNCVLPSVIDTPENRRAMPDADYSRWVAPAALADVILFLASDAARAVHGAALPVIGRS
ncbi:SDR family NAD(P)-dependent oxidoreductase [Pseudoduganella ginsengisoli]|uniref:SDR family NAD(P)-dependent oxidoreductase n=1 Tax=Pseudoduganella ginsengisoli TaxID=1462440 RepID=A0A6L6Q4L0_9BURK|nr:SDR family NAD(P)-dependent oxidoreductase [Pseudoduganella ginsengisoli]MTW04364.1 SDR family NAD(P)-dependent oxidoreductase [Pseudoduganella ginsengisoli]